MVSYLEKDRSDESTGREASEKEEEPVRAASFDLRAFTSIVRYAVAGASLSFPLVFLWIAFSRATFPYELEWMEGAVLDHVTRVANGEALYVEPSLDFVPFIYTPLYFWVGAGVSALAGLEFVTLRAISIAFALGCMALVYALVRRETQSHVHALVGLSLFASSYRVTGAWLDLARVDSMLLFLTLGCIYLVRDARSTKWYLFAAFAATLAFFTKQTAVLILGPVFALPLFLERGVRRFVLPLGFVVMTTAAVFWLDAVTDGWFRYYAFELPSAHRLGEYEPFAFWTHDLGLRFLIALFLSAGWLISLARDRAWRELSFHSACFLGTILASWSSRLHDGGWDNVLLPIYAYLSIAAVCGLRRFEQRAPSAGYSLVLQFALCVQLFLMAYSPQNQLPKTDDRIAGETLSNTISSFEGDVFLPLHGHYSPSLGRGRFAHWMAIQDVFKADPDGAEATKLRAEIDEALVARRFDAVIVDRGWPLGAGFHEHYELASELFDDAHVFWPKTGLKTRPSNVYVPRDQ